MRRTIFTAITGVLLGVFSGAEPAEAAWNGYYEVVGVEADDMLKMRAGPGIGYNVIVGLPNGTLVRIYSCEQNGGTGWCKVSLKQSRGLKGYVSRTYLQEM
ncbi:SH3 domain-containing protein [Falsihalocynthiibacter arcticus]|uniref:Peptide-binding protein n=1 Tax=Falsihalocynthiibacter arcticus TaxID=1579316 RepID=A0A126V3W9_9RHOB|nr:SH3 domain-containing protein [Falsihalocynthiibacter arcticus]AML52847.1 peptide-binding protein [Falsihalocynthiibacter arcticus]